MVRRAKTLGLALIAALAVAALGAAVAGASNFTASKYTTSFEGQSPKGNDVFATEAGTVECKAHFTGSIAAPSESQTVTPTYTECKAFGFLSATVEMSGCDYVFYTNAKVDLICPAFKWVVIKASTCTATIGYQTGLSSVSLTNGPNFIIAKANVGGIVYSATQDGIGCPFNGVGTKFGGTYKQGTAIGIVSTNGAALDIG